MNRRRRRKPILITGTTLCVLIAAAFVVSGWWVLAIQIPTPYGPTSFGLNGGLFGTSLDKYWSAVFVAEDRAVVEASAARPFPNWDWWNVWMVGSRSVIVPIYAVFLAVAVPTLLAWRFWPKPVKPGHCRCGYNLMGNTSGVCPECGEPFEWKGDVT